METTYVVATKRDGTEMRTNNYERAAISAVARELRQSEAFRRVDLCRYPDGRILAAWDRDETGKWTRTI